MEKDAWGVVIPAPLQFNNPATAGLPRYDDEHRGPAVMDAYDLSHCWFDLIERSEAWPSPANPPLPMLEMAKSIPEDQMSDWLRRQANRAEADSCICKAMRSGDLPIWIAPIGEPERLVAHNALLEVDQDTLVAGVYRPPNDRGWLYGRPLFVKKADWAKFAKRLDDTKKVLGPNDKPLLTERKERRWLRLSKALCILHRILKTQIAGEEPAPWIIPPANSFEAETIKATPRHRRYERTSLTIRRALLSGNLTVHLVKNGNTYPVPCWVWENAKVSEGAFHYNGFLLNPLLGNALQDYGDWRCFVSRSHFKAWVANPALAILGDLPKLPEPVDLTSKPVEQSYREPPDKPFVELTQAWL